MFNRIILSFGNQMTGPPMSRDELMAVFDMAGKTAYKTIVLLPSDDQALTATAQTHVRLIKSMKDRLNKMDSSKIQVRIGESISKMVRDGYKADIAIGDDLAVAINEYHSLPMSIDGRVVARHSVTTNVFMAVLQHVMEYVTKYDDANNSAPVDKTAVEYATGQIDPRAIKAAAYVLKNKAPGSTGYCARYVRKGLQHAGFQFQQQARAYQYHTTGQMTKMGYSLIPNQESDPMVGDVVVFDKYGRRYPSGHIAIFSERGWVSDFLQKRANPYGSAYKGKGYYYRILAKGAKPRGSLKTTETRTITKKTVMKLSDIVYNRSKLAAIASREQRTLSSTQFKQLLRDLSDATNIPLAVFELVAQYENGYPNTPQRLLKSDAWEVSKSFRGPFQVGGPHWTDSRGFIKKYLGVKVPSNRNVASIAAQGVASVLYVFHYSKAYRALRDLPLTAELFYLLHNQGPGGLMKIVENKKLTGAALSNAKSQSYEVRKVIARYNTTSSRAII